MKIAILGATSQIASDLIKSMSEAGHHELYLYARRPFALQLQPSSLADTSVVHAGDFASLYSVKYNFDALINFVGVGNPAAATQMGAAIFDVTHKFDSLTLDYLRSDPGCRYVFFSSGAAYGGSFMAPADEHTPAVFPINLIEPAGWYGVAKMYAECRHRTLADVPILLSSFRSQETIAAYLRKTMPNPLILLYP